MFICDHWVHTQFIQNPSLLQRMDQYNFYSSLGFKSVPSLFILIKVIESRVLSDIGISLPWIFCKMLTRSLIFSVNQHKNKHVTQSNLLPTQIPSASTTTEALYQYQISTLAEWYFAYSFSKIYDKL